MIEAPEALFLSDQLNNYIAGKEIIEVIARQTPHKFTFYYGNPERDYPELLTGKRVTGIAACGGMVDILVEDTHLLFTDGANLRMYDGGQRLPAKHQLLVVFSDNSCLVVSVRMYGGILCFRENSFNAPLAEYYHLALTKPQVMADAFCLDYFLQLAHEESASKKSVKAFLATGQTIPGLGNGVLQDILFNAGIHPKTKTGILSEVQKKKLFDSIKLTMNDIYRANGRNTETDLFGVCGKYVPFLSKDKVGKECFRCGGTIKKENYLGGSIYYCCDCQE